jgi:thiamine pyrophosphokinase
LQYRLHNETLALGSPRGVSNVLTATRATISFARGMLLVVHLICNP